MRLFRVLVCAAVALGGAEAPEWESQIAAATAAHSRGDLSDALARYRSLLAEHESKMAPAVAAQLWGNAAAIALASEDEADAALHGFERAVALAPSLADARVNLAICLSHRFGRHADALEHAREAVAMRPSWPKAHHVIATVYQDLGSERAAQRHLNLAAMLATAEEDSLDAVDAAGVDDAGDPEEQRAQWAGSSPPVCDASGGALLAALDADRNNHSLSPEASVLSRSPLVIDLGELINSTLCAALIDAAQSRLGIAHVTGGVPAAAAAAGEADASAATAEGVDDGSIRPPAAPQRTSHAPDSGSRRHGSRVAWLDAHDDRTGAVSSLREAVAAALGMRLERLVMASEPIQVVEYRGAGAEFALHHDSQPFQRRQLTVLVYLTGNGDRLAEGPLPPAGAETGGETWFPLHGDDDERPRVDQGTQGGEVTAAEREEHDGEHSADGDGGDGDGEASSARETTGSVMAALRRAARLQPRDAGLVVAPRRGRAILFFSHGPTDAVAALALGENCAVREEDRETRRRRKTRADPAAIHASRPLLQEDSEKWIANLWLSW